MDGDEFMDGVVSIEVGAHDDLLFVVVDIG